MSDYSQLETWHEGAPSPSEVPDNEEAWVTVLDPGRQPFVMKFYGWYIREAWGKRFCTWMLSQEKPEPCVPEPDRFRGTIWRRSVMGNGTDVIGVKQISGDLREGVNLIEHRIDDADPDEVIEVREFLAKASKRCAKLYPSDCQQLAKQLGADV